MESQARTEARQAYEALFDKRQGPVATMLWHRDMQQKAAQEAFEAGCEHRFEVSRLLRLESEAHERLMLAARQQVQEISAALTAASIKLALTL